MKSSILFKGVDMVLPNGIFHGDLLAEDGKIAAIGPALKEHAATVISDKGLTLMPGAIDPHVHFREPGLTWKEDLESGSRAAVSGGVTTFFDMPNTDPSATTAELIEQKKFVASEKSLANYNFFIGATDDNLDELIKIKNVPGIKVYAGSTTGNLLVKKLENIFAHAPHLIAVHSEDEDTIRANKEKYRGSQDVSDHMRIRSWEAALKSTERVIALAKKYSKRLHICHMSTAEETDLIAEENNPLITCEVTPQHLFLYAPEIYKKLGTFAQMNPPLREKRHGERLWRGLKEGTVHCIGTDHAPHTIEEKSKPFGQAPSGIPGVELMLPVMLNTGASLENVARWTSSNASRVFGIKNKGQLKVGFDADLVLVDTKAKRKMENKNLHTKAKWSAFEGWTLTGWPVATVVNGHVVFREGDFFSELKGKEARCYTRAYEEKE